jgi:starch-binding outer membrane protein, SusD/RagB family
MKKHIKLIYIAAAFISMLVAGCSEDFLDIKPAGKIGYEPFFADTVNIDVMVNGVYNSFLFKDNYDIFDYYRSWMGSVTTDEAESGGQKPAGWPDQYTFDNLTFTSESNVFKNVYGGMFNGVYRATEVIDKLPALREVASEQLKKKIDLRMAETRFLRAAYYFVLTRSFGGVPVVDHLLLASEYNMPRGTIKDVYNLMEKDLKAAIPYLPLYDKNDIVNLGRPTKGAAQSLLAKMYIYESSYYTYYGTNDTRMGDVQDRWQEAYDLCQEIINSEKYRLIGIDGDTYSTFWSPTTNGFRYLFSVEGNNNDESIFAIQHTKDPNQWGSYTFGSSLTQFVGANIVFKKDGTKTGPDGHHWGYWCPTKKLFNLFDPLDVRRKVAIGVEAESINSIPRDSVYSLIDNQEGWYVIATLQDPVTGYANVKYEIGPHASMVKGQGYMSNPHNIYYIRYADVVLLAAEAAMMLNDQANASKYFNLIRARARNCGDGIHPTDLTGTVTKQEIMDERAREFALEGERFFDLVRWKEAVNVINGLRMDWWDAHGISDQVIYENKHDFFPLPSFETSKNSNLKQYAGW